MPYATKQRQAVLRTLEGWGERPAAASELAAALRREGCSVSMATVYRQLEFLARTGRIHKIATEAGTLYQYCPRREEGGPCFLLRCAGCGRLEHLDCPQFRALYRHLKTEHHFQADPRQTVLTGLCGVCAGKEAGHEEN